MRQVPGAALLDRMLRLRWPEQFNHTGLRGLSTELPAGKPVFPKPEAFEPSAPDPNRLRLLDLRADIENLVRQRGELGAASPQAFPVRPGEAGMVALGALLGKMLGMTSADVAAGVQNYLGVRQQAADTVHQKRLQDVEAQDRRVQAALQAKGLQLDYLHQEMAEHKDLEEQARQQREAGALEADRRAEEERWARMMESLVRKSPALMAQLEEAALTSPAAAKVMEGLQADIGGVSPADLESGTLGRIANAVRESEKLWAAKDYASAVRSGMGASDAYNALRSSLFPNLASTGVAFEESEERRLWVDANAATYKALNGLGRVAEALELSQEVAGLLQGQILALEAEQVSLQQWMAQLSQGVLLPVTQQQYQRMEDALVANHAAVVGKRGQLRLLTERMRLLHEVPSRAMGQPSAGLSGAAFASHQWESGAPPILNLGLQGSGSSSSRSALRQQMDLPRPLYGGTWRAFDDQFETETPTEYLWRQRATAIQSGVTIAEADAIYRRELDKLRRETARRQRGMSHE